MNRTFGGELRRLRGEADLTLAHVADATGWSIVYLSDIERNRRNPPSPEHIEAILRFMKKEQHLPEMLRLAAEARKSIEIQVPQSEHGEVANMLVALARRAKAGEIDPDTARQILRLLGEDKKGPG